MIVTEKSLKPQLPVIEDAGMMKPIIDDPLDGENRICYWAVVKLSPSTE